jgi:tetratricopeptide (TPR) repeat protein
MTKRWSEADLRFLRDNAAKMDVQAIAERLGARIDEVEAKIAKLGLLDPAAAAPGKTPSSFREMFKHSEAARKEYEKGASALQKKKYEEAEKHFRAVLDQYSDEKELADRSRLYLAVCERQIRPSRSAQADSDDVYYAAVVLKNRERYAEAIEQLKKSSRRNGDGRSAYLMACCYVKLNERDKAMEALERAVSEDEANRALARRDPDFEGVRETLEFQKLTAATA